MKVLKISVNDG